MDKCIARECMAVNVASFYSLHCMHFNLVFVQVSDLRLERPDQHGRRCRHASHHCHRRVS